MSGVPYFPVTLPARTVVGNLSAQAGVAEAIPIPLFSTADEITFTQAGTGAVARTVQSKERDVVSVKDFGAIGDGVTDDTAAFQAAHDASPEGSLILIPRPSVEYLINSQISLTKGMRWIGSSDESEQQNTGSRLHSTAAINVFNVNPAASAKVFQFENLTIVGGTNGINYAAAGKYISRQSYMKNINFDAQTNAGVKNVMGMIGCQHQRLHFEGTGSYGLWSEGDSLLNSTQWDSIRAVSKTVEGIHLKDTASKTASVLFINPIIESNPGRGIYVSAVSSTLVSPWFENNGSSAGAPDIYLDAVGAIGSEISILAGLMGTANAAQSNVRVFVNANNCFYGEDGTLHNSASDQINANDKTLRLRLSKLVNVPIIISPTRMDLVNRLAFNESGNVAASDLSPTVNPNIGVAVTRGNITRAITKAVCATSAFTAAALTQDFTIWTTSAKTQITQVWIRVTQTFTGTAWATAVVRLGKTVGGQEYIVDKTVFAGTPTYGAADADLGASINRAAAVQGGDYINGGNVTLRLTTTGGNISAITAGALEVYIETQLLP